MTTAIATTVRVRPSASSSVSECDDNDNRSNSATIAATIAATAAAAAATTSTAMPSSCCYETIVDDLCRRLETSGYYTPKSSSWFLRGAMGKHEEQFNRANATMGSFQCRLRFQTEAFTDVLVARVMGGPSQTAKDPITTKTTTKTTGEEEHSNENGEMRDKDGDDESDIQNENETRCALNANDDKSDDADKNNNSNNNSNNTNTTNTTNNNDNNDNKENGNNTDDGDHPHRNAKPTTTPAGSCLLVTKALLRGDPGKYLPAITASLSAWASLVVAGNSNSNADPSSPAVVKFWVSLLVDPLAPLELHDRLLNALLDVITVTLVVVVVPDSRSPSRSPSWSPMALPSTREFLEAVISEPVFSLSGPTLLPSSSSSSSSSSSVIRRASFAIRFLSRSCCSALPRSDRNALVRALETSGALKWLTGVLSTGTGDDNNSNSNSNSNNDNDNDYHSRLRLLDVLLEECVQSVDRVGGFLVALPTILFK